MAGTGNVSNTGRGNGHGQDGYGRDDGPDWDELFPPIDYDALEKHAWDAAKIAIDRCWLPDGTPQRGHWSGEMRSDFAAWAEELTAAYMAESHPLYRPGRILALMRDANMARAVQIAMRGRQNAIYTRYRRACYDGLWTAFTEFARYVGRIPQTTMPPASPPAQQPPQQRRKEVI